MLFSFLSPTPKPVRTFAFLPGTIVHAAANPAAERYVGHWGDSQRVIEIRTNNLGPGADGIAVEWLSSIHCEPGTIMIDCSKINPDGVLEFKTRFPNLISRGGVGTAVWSCVILDGRLQCTSVNDHHVTDMDTLAPICVDITVPDWAQAFESEDRRRKKDDEDRRRRMLGMPRFGSLPSRNSGMARMLVAVNGRDLYRPLQPPTALLEDGAVLPPAEMVINALRLEAELRKHPATLAKFTDPAVNPNAIIEQIQRGVGDRFELGQHAEAIIRCAQTLYPGCNAMKEIPHYVRYNRSCDGLLNEGDTIPDHKMFSLLPRTCGAEPTSEMNPVALSHFIRPGRPLIVAAGSIT